MNVFGAFMKTLVTLLLLLTLCSCALAANPFGWRGDGTGLAPDATPPTTWDGAAKKGILWSTKVGETLYNSPIVAGDKVFTLSEPGLLTCLDAQTGKILWSKPTSIDDLPTKPESPAPPAEIGNTTPTPMTDGQYLYILFGNGVATCFDLDGNRQWIQYLSEPSTTGHGRAASPCLIDGKFVVAAGVVTALDARTGKILWKADSVLEACGSLVPATITGAHYIVSPTGHVLNPDGTIVAKAPGQLLYTSPIVGDNRFFFIDSTAFAFDLPKPGAGAGKPKKTWAQDLEGEFFASPVLYDGLIYAVSNQGKYYVLDVKDGSLVQSRDLDIANMSGRPGVTAGALYPSLALAGKYLYISNDQGETLVLEPGKEFHQVALNNLNDKIAGNLVFVGNKLFLRTRQSIYCIGE